MKRQTIDQFFKAKIPKIVDSPSVSLEREGGSEKVEVIASTSRCLSISKGSEDKGLNCAQNAIEYYTSYRDIGS